MRSAWLSLGFIAAIGLGCTVERTFAEGSGGAGGGATTGALSTTTATSSSAGGMGGSTSSGTPCGTGTDVCVPETPTGWQGPIALYEGPGDVGTPFCPSAYATEIGEYFAGLDPGAADCGCDCADATGIVCNGSMYLCNTSDCNLAQACLSFNADYTLPPYPGTFCQALNPGAKVQTSSPSPTSVGSCMASSNPTIPTPTWATASKVCGGATTVPTGCMAGEICAPTGDSQFATLCIAQPGDVACTDTFYSVQHVIYEDFAETRTCTTCTCDTAVSTCGGNVSFAHNGCTVGDGGFVAGGCGAVFSTAAEATYDPDPSGTCAVLGGVVMGDATPTGALTLCCNG